MSTESTKQILVVGAGGRLGQNVLLQALDQGYEVRAFVRSEDAILLRNARLSLFIGDAQDSQALYQALSDIDYVVSTVGSRAMDSSKRTMTEITEKLENAMQKRNISRLVSVAGAGILDDAAGSLASLPEKLRYLTGDHLAMYDYLKSSALDWTLVCPKSLMSGGYTGDYRVALRSLPPDSKALSLADCAHFMVATLPSDTYYKHRVGIAR